jgi:hypothetical protein
MATHARRWALLSLALAMLALGLVACQAPDSAAARGKSGNIVVSPAVAGSSSPTPTLSPLTIGVWTSTMTPGARDTITIYVLCMLQDPSRGRLTGPAVGIAIRVRLSDPVNQSFTGTTGRDGLAQVRVSFTDAHPGKPVIVDVVTVWHGMTYQGQTYFLPGAGGVPSPTPSPSPSLTPSPASTLPPTPAPSPMPG